MYEWMNEWIKFISKQTIHRKVHSKYNNINKQLHMEMSLRLKTQKYIPFVVVINHSTIYY